MKPRLACADFTFPLLSHDKSLDLIRSLDFAGVDIGLFEGRSHLWPSTQFQRLKPNARLLKRKLSDRGLRCADLFLQVDSDFAACAINHPQSAVRQRAAGLFEQTIEYALIVGARHITILPGVAYAREPETESWARMVEELSWRVERTWEAGLVLGVEAHVGSIASTPKKALQLAKSVQGLTLTLDCTHFIRNGAKQAELDPLFEHASHFHARGSRKGRIQVSLKDNILDHAKILRRLKSVGYTGWIGVEYVWINWEHCNECDNLSETILFRDLLQAQVAELF